jgi:uncharacterized protein YabE (DUF348 family)
VTDFDSEVVVAEGQAGERDVTESEVMQADDEPEGGQFFAWQTVQSS